MSTVPYPPQRQLSVGEVLDLTFRIYRATLAKCLLFATCGVLAGQLPSIYLFVKGRRLPQGPNAMGAWLAQMQDPALEALYVVGVALTLVFYAAVLLRQHRIITEGASGGELSAAVRRTPALIGLAILVGLGFAACFVPAMVTGGTLRVLLLLAALIAICYLVVAISCAQTILLVDGSGPVSSLTRSWRLTSGAFWRLSLIYTVALLIFIALYLVIVTVLGFLAGVLGRGDVVMLTASGEVIGVLLAALATPFLSALALAVLGDLKVRKEGADLAQRISATA